MAVSWLRQIVVATKFSQSGKFREFTIFRRPKTISNGWQCFGGKQIQRWHY